jgi:hypothetical protein
VLRLPEHGTLVAGTDLHGNLGDFRVLVARFEALGADAQLVLCGDMVHGPALRPEAWPDYLGSYYVDQSAQLLTEARGLQLRHPGRVHFLLGNHEHAHVGGPVLSKFAPDEAAHLERRLGSAAAIEFRRWLTTWPWVAVAPGAGLALTHAAPHAQISTAADLEDQPLRGYESTPLIEMADSGPLGALTWARTATAERAEAFLRALHPGCRVALFGHDIIREGHLVEHEPLLCFSTSFGCHDGDKLYLEWDLSRPAASATAVARAGLRPLHPDAPPVHRHRGH